MSKIVGNKRSHRGDRHYRRSRCLIMIVNSVVWKPRHRRICRRICRVVAAGPLSLIMQIDAMGRRDCVERF